MTTYRVIWTPTVFPRHRDFDDRDEAETYRERMERWDAEASLHQLGEED